MRSGIGDYDLPLAIVIIAAACGGGPSSTADAMPGTAEFGLTEAQIGVAIDDVESRIAACMSAAGFEYVALDTPAVRAAMAAVGSAPGLSDASYVAQYGYGISTQFDNPAQKTGFGAVNRAIISGLSPSDQVAYRFTLLGEHQDATFAVTLDNEDFSQVSGCTKEAVSQVFNAADLTATYVNPKDQLVDQDPRVIAATEAWASCMRDAGFDYPQGSAGEKDISERLRLLLDGRAPQDLDPTRLALLVNLQGEEKAIARADYDCATSLLDPVKAKVEAEVFGKSQG